MTVKATLHNLFDRATEAALTIALAVGFAAFAWQCIEEVWSKGGPYAAPATLLMACLGVLLVSNSAGLASALMNAIDERRP